MIIILTCLANFQEYILDNIKNLLLFDNKDIIVITEKHFFDKFKDFSITLVDKDTLDDFNFDKNSNLDRSFRNGFWHLCSLRFFYIYSYIYKNNLKNVLHIENDVLIYKNLNNTNLFNSDKVCCVFDCHNRVIPSVIFIPNAQSFEPIIKNYDHNQNDMVNLARFSENIIERLPIFINDNTPFTKNFNKYNIIFDGAAIGQYLGGIDKIHNSGDTRGFVNETCIIKFDNYNFFWVKNENNLFYPSIKINNVLIPIFNLHIHSKQLQNFMSVNPIEQKFINLKN